MVPSETQICILRGLLQGIGSQGVSAALSRSLPPDAIRPLLHPSRWPLTTGLSTQLPTFQSSTGASAGTPGPCSLTHTIHALLLFAVAQSLSCVQLFVTPWTAAHQASPSSTISQSLLKLMSIESLMPSNHLVLCHPLLLLPLIFPSIRVFSNKSTLHQMTKVLEFQLQHQSFQWIFRIYFL